MIPEGNWQTTYTDPNGNYENAAAVLQGNSGTYYLPDGNVGSLSTDRCANSATL